MTSQMRAVRLRGYSSAIPATASSKRPPASSCRSLWTKTIASASGSTWTMPPRRPLSGRRGPSSAQARRAASSASPSSSKKTPMEPSPRRPSSRRTSPQRARGSALPWTSTTARRWSAHRTCTARMAPRASTRHGSTPSSTIRSTWITRRPKSGPRAPSFAARCSSLSRTRTASGRRPRNSPPVTSSPVTAWDSASSYTVTVRSSSARVKTLIEAPPTFSSAAQMGSGPSSRSSKQPTILRDSG
mmetsp:Transcript_12055/g.50734  ORF Transcript_12055/g.50734 Transcript_12055/m.50734 type:complete len:244 (-) Transcript_12055:2664-3395(-)